VAAGVKLPNVDSAVVRREKLIDYLLDTGHSVGGPKAMFLQRFGYNRDNWTVLRHALLQHARLCDVVDARHADHGVYFEIVGPLSTPDGRNPSIRVVWLIDTGAEAPRLITIVPSRRTSRAQGT
jgi:hypothetical protein